MLANEELSHSVQKTPLGIMFLQQSRGIAFEDEGKIHPMPDGPDIKINVSAESGLQYCPFFRRGLEKLVEASPQAFEELAEQHKKFYKSLIIISRQPTA